MIEDKHSVRLKIESFKVFINGLQQEKTANCQKELEDTCQISICLKGYQVVYLEEKFNQKIDEFRAGCCQTLISLPAVQRSLKGLTDSSFITVNGRPADVEIVRNGIQEILGENLKQETVNIKCVCSILAFWEKRWKEIVEDYKKQHDILIEFWFSQSKISDRQLGNNEALLNEVVVTFLFYGKSVIVDQFKKLILLDENGELLEQSISHTVHVCQALKKAISRKTFGIHDLSVKVEFPKKNVILLLAPTFKSGDFATAKIKLEMLIDEIPVVIPCNDRVLVLILQKKPSLLQEDLPLDLKTKVSVTFCSTPQIKLTGSKDDINTAEDYIEICLNKIRATLGSENLSVDPLCKPFFHTKRYLQICFNLEHSKQVVCTCPFLREQTRSNKILFQTSFQPGQNALCVQLSLVRGDILKEVVDVIVNPANSKLDHIGGLAKAIADAGGSQIQKECTRYVKENGEVNAGKAICSSPGLLPFKKLIHSVGPRWMGGQNNESFQLFSAVNNSLCAANRENLQSIALPAIGTGVFAVPVSICAEESLRAVKEFCIHHPSACVKDIRFVLYTKADAQEFLKCFDPRVQWYYRDDHRQYSPYTPHDSAAIESSFQANKSVRLTINGKIYIIDTVRMTQVNEETSYERPIRRQPSDGQLSLKHAATPEDDEEERALAAVSSEQLIVNLRGPKENLSKAVKELKQELSSCMKTEQMPLKKVPKSTKKSLKEVAEKHGVQVKFCSKGRTATIKGYIDALDKALSEMQKLILANMPEDEIEFPPEWEPQEENLKLVSVPTSSDEWQAVSSRFQSTMLSTPITSIQRIQNKWLWKKYAQHKKMIEEKNGGASNEKDLFHGTRSNMPKEIYDYEEGFDMRYSAQGMWGQANYFAVNASYSNKYAYTNGARKELFLVKVLTGASYECDPDNSLRMPPKKCTSGAQLGQSNYDTVTGITNGSRVYMTYDNQKAYPAYLITYGDRFSRHYI